MSAMRRQVLKEPTIAVVPPEAIATNSAQLLILDMNNVKISELEFKTQFSLVANRTCSIDSLVTYFETDFLRPESLKEKNVQQHTLSTSPWSTATHWKQTVFFLEEEVRIEKGGPQSFHVRFLFY